MKGIWCVRDILNSNGQIQTQGEITNKYGIKCTFIDHYRLVKAIPPEYLNTIGDTVGHGPGIIVAVQALICNKKGCKKYMNILRETGNIIPSRAQVKWCTQLNIDDDVCLWNSIYKQPFELTMDANIRYFQFRILHRILTTNRYLNQNPSFICLLNVMLLCIYGLICSNGW
jgi:hypothetical protein